MPINPTVQFCPLCGSRSAEPFHRDRKRDYFRCLSCDLVFVPLEQQVSPEQEKARYDLHRNTAFDPGYRAFLSRLFQPLETKLLPGARGLDFGCGPTPTLSLLFQEAGYRCDNYDLHYANDPAVLEQKYDFLTCSETLEHLVRPREEFERFLRLVKPGGWIGIMTQLREPEFTPFGDWFYKDDATHIGFFSRQVFQTLEKAYGLRLEFHPDSVMLFQTSEKPRS
ncbi:MAG: hypothetical protein A2X46_18640 [Lentisphaerae bacterium GWF2_57_35]|nr:MAG: hypothetical protein A2X46_18640 [Lentisphaerae bacterium GWF2_57_35]